MNTLTPMHPIRISLLFFLVLVCAGCNRRTPVVATNVELCLVADAPSNSTVQASLKEEEIHLTKPPVLSQPTLFYAQAYESRSGWDVRLQFAEPSVGEFEAVTRSAIGKRLAFVASGKVLAAPVVRAAITNGTVVISGQFSEAEAKALAEEITPADAD